MKDQYAIISMSGKQFIVFPGLRITTDRFYGDSQTVLDAGAIFTIKDVLFYKDKELVEIGKPTLANRSATLEVVEHVRGEKQVIYKKTQRETYQRKNGHRQENTVLLVKSIE